jgi:hypothetical protein
VGGGGIEAGVSSAGGVAGPIGFDGGDSSEPQCTWTPATRTNTTRDGLPDLGPGVDPDAQLTDESGRLGWIRVCDDGTGPQFVWQEPVDPVDLVGPAADRARALLPLPSPDMNPTPDAGGIVNVGLWLAIDDPGLTVARASLGNAWAEATGTVTGFAVDLGNGERVECDGLGVPIAALVPDLDTAEPGPCGATYLASSPDDAPYRMTYTTRYEITWATSDGRTGTLGTVERSITFDYDVDEIQTVGEAG